MNAIEKWLYGIASAFIGGGASAITSGLTSMGIDPEHYNLNSGLKHVLVLAGANFVVGGTITMMAYLKQSPLPQVNGK